MWSPELPSLFPMGLPGMRLCTRWPHQPVCVHRAQQGVTTCVCASSRQWVIYSRQAWGSFSFKNKLIFPGKMARKFLKVPEMELLSLFLAKKNWFCGSNYQLPMWTKSKIFAKCQHLHPKQSGHLNICNCDMDSILLCSRAQIFTHEYHHSVTSCKSWNPKFGWRQIQCFYWPMKELYLSSLNLPSEAIAGGWGGAEILLINSVVWLFFGFSGCKAYIWVGWPGKQQHNFCE